jgi:pyridoxine 4-dehydrogenase
MTTLNHLRHMNPTTQLGDKPIRRIGFGAMQLAGPAMFGPPANPDAAIAVLRRAVELGVDHIDTSQYYGPNIVNELIRKALFPYPQNLKIVTKVGARVDGSGRVFPAQLPHELREGVEANLRTLGVESVALVNLRLHDTDVPLEDQLDALEDLRRQGKTDLIGISNVSETQLGEALGHVEISEVQNAYSVIDRHDEGILALCEAHEIAFVPFGPLGSAYRKGPSQLAADPAIGAVAEKHDATPTQIALAWLLARYERMLLIPGTSSIEHLEENMAAGQIRLDQADLATLARVKRRA